MSIQPYHCPLKVVSHYITLGNIVSLLYNLLLFCDDHLFESRDERRFGQLCARSSRYPSPPFIDELVYQNCALLSDTIECFTPNAHFRLKDCLFYAVYHVVEV